MKGGCGGDFHHPDFSCTGIGPEHLVQSRLLEFELLLQRLDQRHLAVGLQHRIGQRQHGLPAQQTRAGRALGPGSGIGLLHRAQPGHAARGLAALLGQGGQPPTGIGGVFDRPRVGLHIALPCRDGAGQRARLGCGAVGRLLAQFGRLPQRASGNFGLLCRCCHLLEFGRGQGAAAQLQVDQRQLARHIGLQRMRRMVAAERPERARRRFPVLEADQHRCGVDQGAGVHGRTRRQAAQRCHAREVRNGFARLAPLARQVALLVDGGSLAFGQLGAATGAWCREGQHFTIGRFGARKCGALEAVVRNHRPGHPAQFGLRRRHQGQRLTRHHSRLFSVAQSEQHFGRVGEHGAASRVVSERTRKAQRTGHRLALQLGPLGAVCRRGFERGVAQQGRIARVRGARIGPRSWGRTCR